MTDKKDPPSSGPGVAGESAGPKRPHATLDLKAVEMKGEDKSGAEKTSGAGTAGKTEAKPDAKSPAPGQAPASASPPAAAPASKGGSALGRTISHLVAGLAGGTVVLFGGDRLAQVVGLPPSSQKIEVREGGVTGGVGAAAGEAAAKDGQTGAYAAMADRMHRLEIFVSDVEALRGQQEKLAGETKALGDAVAAVTATAGSGTAAFEQRVAKLEGQLSTLESAANAEDGGGRIAQLAAVTGKISDLEAAFAQQIAALRQSLPQDVEQRLGVIGEASETAKSAMMRIDSDLQQSKTALARLNKGLESLKADQDRIASAAQAAREEAGRVGSGLNEMRGVLDQQARTFAKAADVAAAVTPVTGLISKLEGNLEGVLKKEEERQSSAERIVVSLELANLKRAVERGQGFATELEAVRTASGGRLKLEALDRYKDQGVPTLAQLQANGRTVIDAALEAAVTTPDASVWERMLAGAKSVVRIRKVHQEGDETSGEAVAARIEAALAEGRLADVLAEAQKLPEGVAARIAGWRDQAAARLSVDQAIMATEAELKAALATQASRDAAPLTGSGSPPAAAGPLPGQP